MWSSTKAKQKAADKDPLIFVLPLEDDVDLAIENLRWKRWQRCHPFYSFMKFYGECIR